MIRKRTLCPCACNSWPIPTGRRRCRREKKRRSSFVTTAGFAGRKCAPEDRSLARKILTWARKPRIYSPQSPRRTQREPQNPKSKTSKLTEEGEMHGFWIWALYLISAVSATSAVKIIFYGRWKGFLQSP